VDRDGKLTVYELGSALAVTAPYPVRESFARLTPDGQVVALVAGPSAGDVSIWRQGTGGRPNALVQVPAAFIPADSYVIWSPRTQAAMYAPSFGAAELFVVDATGVVQRATLGDGLMHVGVWRSEEELTILSAKPQTAFPWSGVTLWSWRPPAAPVRMAGPLTLSTYPRWSPDGQTLATIEEDPTGRTVHLRGSGDRTFVSERDLARGPDGCDRGTVQFIGVSWSPDGQTVAVLGRGRSELVALTNIRTGQPRVFAAPLGSGCYIPGYVEWSGGQVVVPIFGPECGESANGLNNVLAVIDPASGKLSYVAISRKGLLKVSGRWVAIAAPNSDGKATTFFSLDQPTIRVTVQLSGLLDYCCAP
jgi:WD40 repeat protein